MSTPARPPRSRTLPDASAPSRSHDAATGRLPPDVVMGRLKTSPHSVAPSGRRLPDRPTSLGSPVSFQPSSSDDELVKAATLTSTLGPRSSLRHDDAPADHERSKPSQP